MKSIRYFVHKDLPEVTCELFSFPNNSRIRTSKWIWSKSTKEVGSICSEIFTIKEKPKNFDEVFVEISQEEFNIVWGNKLQRA